MISMANDILALPAPVEWNKTAFARAIFVCVYRPLSPMLIDDVQERLSLWVKRMVPLETMAESVGHMIGRGWLIKSGGRLWASVQDLEVARPLMTHIIGMLTQGPRAGRTLMPQAPCAKGGEAMSKGMKFGAVMLALMPTPAPLRAQEAGNADGVEQQSQGDDFYCGERRLGQWFYCVRPKPSDRTAPQAPPMRAAERMAAITKQLDELKARAILEPTQDNVIAYVRFQREQLDRASTFSDTWQRALWQNPDLDYTLQRPVSTVGKRAWLDNRKADRDAVLSGLSQRYGLFYFYAQSCGACEIFGPILKSVADSHGMAVMAVSMDGGPNRDFPDYAVDAGQRARMGVPGNETPALVLFDTATKKTIPIGFGMLSADEIMDRIFMLTNTKVGSDY